MVVNETVRKVCLTWDTPSDPMGIVTGYRVNLTVLHILMSMFRPALLVESISTQQLYILVFNIDTVLGVYMHFSSDHNSWS